MIGPARAQDQRNGGADFYMIRKHSAVPDAGIAGYPCHFVNHVLQWTRQEVGSLQRLRHSNQKGSPKGVPWFVLERVAIRAQFC
jgi:hypothetical protein